jgi:hypothetical protein
MLREQCPDVLVSTPGRLMDILTQVRGNFSGRCIDCGSMRVYVTLDLLQCGVRAARWGARRTDCINGECVAMCRDLRQGWTTCWVL